MSKLEKQINSILASTDKSSWCRYEFGEIATNISERIDPAVSGVKIYVGLEHIDPDSIHIRRYGDPSDVKGIKLKVYKGDVIFGKRRAYQRKAAIAEFDGICSAHAMVLRANTEVIEKDLFPFFIHSDSFMTRALEISEGSLSPTIKWNILKKQEFVLPPKDVQKKISELLSSVDSLNEKQLNTLAKSSQTRKILFGELTSSKNRVKNLKIA